MLRRFSTLRRKESKLFPPTDHHKKLISIAGSLYPSDPSFPWRALSRHAESILKAHKTSEFPDELDTYLNEFIFRHPKRAVAIASVGHALSNTEAKRLPALLKEDLSGAPTFRDFLESLLALSYVRNDVIGPEDCIIIPRLLELITRTHQRAPYEDFQWFLVLLQPRENDQTGVLKSSILADIVSTFFVRGIKLFREQLLSAWLERRYKFVLQCASVLANFKLGKTRHQDARYLSAPHLLDQHFSAWRAWATWEPNEKILDIFETVKQPNAAVIDIIELEGPSLKAADLPTEKYRLAAAGNAQFEFRGMNFYLENGDTANIVAKLDLLCIALCSILLSRNEYTTMKLSFLTYVVSHRPLTELGISFLEETIRIQKHSLYSHIGLAMESMDKMTEIPPTIALRLFWEFTEAGNKSIGPQFRRYFGQELKISALKNFKRMQHQFLQEVANGSIWNANKMELVKKLHTLGAKIRNLDDMQSQLDTELLQTLSQWPQQTEIEIYDAILFHDQKTHPQYYSPLAQKILEYLSHALAGSRPLDPMTMDLLKSLFMLWKSRKELSYKNLSTRLAQPAPGFNPAFRAECISRLRFEPFGFVAALEAIIIPSQTEGATQKSIHQLAHMMAKQNATERCWRMLLWQMMSMHKQKLEAWVVSNLSLQQWLYWMEALQLIFTGEISNGHSEEMSRLRATILWSQDIWYLSNPVEVVVDDVPKNLRALIFRGPDIPLKEEIRAIMFHLGSVSDPAITPIMRLLLAELEDDGQNITLVQDSMDLLLQASPNGIEATHHIIRKIQTQPPEIAATYMTCWMRGEALEESDLNLLVKISELMGIDFLNVLRLTEDHLARAREQLEQCLGDLFAEAVKLEQARQACRRIDPGKTRIMLAEAGIEDSCIVDDLLADLPPSLIGVVGRTNDDELEMQISLDKLTMLKRKGLGLENTSSILVRLVPELGELGVPAFCIHPGQDSKKYGHDTHHSPCLVPAGATEMDAYECYGKLSPGIFQMNRILWSFLKENGMGSLQAIYDHLVTEIADLSTKCMICMNPAARSHDGYRPGLCGQVSCLDILSSSQLDIHLSDLWEHPEVVDLLLAVVYAATSTNRWGLLKNCPIQDMRQLTTVINSLPAMSTLQNAADQSERAVLDLGSDVAALLIWVCSAYGGFLVTVSSNLKIPQLPGSHQFLLASASPQLESAFASRASASGSQLVFHGTGWDSLYPILSSGLQVMSRTTYQTNGAAYGEGIYVSTEPATAAGFAKSTVTWANSQFNGFRVLLGCELVGSWNPVRQNIYVITDPVCLMVRFVFLVPDGTNMPAAAHLTPAMTSVLASLKSGVL